MISTLLCAPFTHSTSTDVFSLPFIYHRCNYITTAAIATYIVLTKLLITGLYSKELLNTFLLLAVQQLLSVIKSLLSTISVESLTDRGVMVVGVRQVI